MWITRLLLVASTLTLSACSTPPQWLANHYNRQDPCQNYHNRQNYQYPEWCGASAGRTYIYNNRGVRQGYVK
jgi:starvation-inducible outer membrane lipoprotein